MADKEKTEKKVKEKKNIFKKKKTEAKAVQQPLVIQKPHVSKRQRGFDEKKATLAVKARQTKWAPVWAVLRKHGTGKKIHPSAMTKYKRSCRRTKLHIKPRRIKKWHLG